MVSTLPLNAGQGQGDLQTEVSLWGTVLLTPPFHQRERPSRDLPGNSGGLGGGSWEVEMRVYPKVLRLE